MLRCQFQCNGCSGLHCITSCITEFRLHEFCVAYNLNNDNDFVIRDDAAKDIDNNFAVYELVFIVHIFTRSDVLSQARSKALFGEGVKE